MSESAAPEPLTIDIVICTFHREALLRRLLDSLEAMDPAPATTFRVIVADNSDEASARAAVQEAAATLTFDVVYLEAHPPNISVARNAAVARATAPFVAFLDDDQEVTPGWLATAAAALRRHRHDVYFGPFEPVFADPDNAGLVARQMFTRASTLPDGAEVAPGRAARLRQGFVLATSNTVFRRETMLAEDAPFDFYLGANGGEDLLLMARMHRAGRRFGWMSGAKVFDDIPASRCEIGYLARRAVAGGQSFAIVTILTSPRPRLTALTVPLVAIAQLAAGLLPYAKALVAGDLDERQAQRIAMAGRWGKLTYRSRRLPLYRWEDASRRSPA
ncbi:glycosyltransferase [Acuticoccus sediminis]|uniref:glycosyltransferase n=1 Tax=Acuticoccus sediminis TaxID=2184697 RepID=UPI001CFEDB50|nr:glycosyltransferase family 2 protein [Acuticoccus sediminis]